MIISTDISFISYGFLGLEYLANDLDEPAGKIHQILNSLSQPLQYDMRMKFEKPMFRRGVTSLADLCVGTVVTGKFNFIFHFSFN